MTRRPLIPGTTIEKAGRDWERIQVRGKYKALEVIAHAMRREGFVLKFAALAQKAERDIAAHLGFKDGQFGEVEEEFYKKWDALPREEERKENDQ